MPLVGLVLTREANVARSRTERQIRLLVAIVCLPSAVGCSASDDGQRVQARGHESTSADEDAIVEFPEGTDPIDAAGDAAVAFMGVVIKVWVDPIPAVSEGPPSPAIGRRIATMEVEDAYAGPIAPGDTIDVWYGTELSDKGGISEPQNTSLAPELGQRHVVLSELQPDDAIPSLGTSLIPIQGSGVGVLLAEGGTGVNTVDLADLVRAIEDGDRKDGDR